MGMTDNLGGIETYLINYYRKLNKDNIQFDFTNIYPNKLCFQDEIEQLGGKIYKVSNYYKHPFKYIKEVKKIIRDKHYKIIHCNMNSAVMLYPLIAAKFAGAKIIIAHAHNNSSDKGIIKTILHNINKHFIPLFVNNYFACSEESAKWFFTSTIIKNKKYEVIKNAIDTKKFEFNVEKRIEIRKKLNIAENTLVIGHVGRFATQKNHTFLIDIFKEIQKKKNDSKLILIGIGPKQDEIKEKVKKLELEENVLFLNNRNNVNEIMQAMDVFVLPSLYEGLGIVLVEAQSSGLPSVTTDEIPTIAEVSNKFYRLSLKKTAKMWAETILKCQEEINNREQNEKCKLYDIEKCILDLEEKYKNFNKIKICHFVNGIVNGGVERVILNYFKNINKENYDLHIVTQGENDEKCLQEFNEQGFIVHTVTKKKQSILKNFKDIRKILKNEKFDIIHCHMSTTNLFPLFYGWLEHVKVRINHSHLTVPNISLAEKNFIKFAKLFDTNRFACSKDAAKFLFGTTKNVSIINNAIELEKFEYNEETRRKMRNELNIANDKIIIGHVGRFVEQKNHKFIIEFFNKLYKENKKYQLLLIGTGELEEEIKTKVEELKLNDAVLFLETRNDVNKIMQAMDIFLFPSLYEGLGIVLIEAQTSGLYCLASSNTPIEVKVTDRIKLLDLETEKWKKEIENIEEYDRKSYFKEISSNGFNIKIEASKLDKLYKEMIRK